MVIASPAEKATPAGIRRQAPLRYTINPLMTGTEPFPEHTSKRRSARTWAVRLVAGFIAIGAIAYGTMPWWLPTGWLAQRLVNQLSADLKRTVTIERVTVGWVEGIAFEGITIADRPDSPFSTLARIEQLRCSFEPLTTLVTGRVHKIIVDQPTFNLAVDETGRFNISDLGQRQEDGALPSRNFLIRGLLCNVQTPRGSDAIRFDRLECSVDPATGTLRFLGEVHPPGGSIAGRGAGEKQLRIDAEITVPRLKPSATLGGGIEVRWVGLALSDLPLKIIPKIPIEQVDGTTTGTLDVETEPNLDMNVKLAIDLRGVRIRRADQPETATVPDAKVQADFHWDPNTDVILVRSLACETQAIRFSGKGAGEDAPAVRLDLQGTPPMEARVAGAVKDWALLRREWPAIERAAAQAGIRLEGQAEFKIAAAYEQRAYQVAIEFDGPRTACRIERNGRTLFDAPGDIPKHLDAKLSVVRRDGLLIQPEVALTLGGVSLNGRGKVKLPDPMPAEPTDRIRALLEAVVPSADSQWTLQCTDMLEIKSRWPPLGDVELLREWRGPIEVSLACTPATGGNQARADVKMEPSTTVRLGELFAKETGLPLVIHAGCTLPPATESRLSDLALAISHGTSTLRLGENATMDYRFALTNGGHGRDVPPLAIEASWHLPIRATGVEHLAPLWPGWKRLIEANPSRHVAGDLTVAVDARLSSRPLDDVERLSVEVNADDLAVRWDDLLDKPAGTAVEISGAFRREQLDGRGDSGWSIDIRRPSGTLAAEYRQAEPDKAGGELEHVRVRVNVLDFARWIEISPWLRRAASDYRPTGGFTLELDSLCAGDGQDVKLTMDATQTGFEVLYHGVVTKSPGGDAKLTAHLRTAEPGDAPTTSRWMLEDSEILVAGLHLSEITGSAELAAPTSQPATVSIRRLMDRQALPSLRTIDLETRGTLVVDNQIAGLHREIRRWCEEHGLTGTTAMRVRVSGKPETIAIAGSLDAEDLECTLKTGGDVVPTIHKPAGTPLRVMFDAATVGSSPGEPQRLRVDELTIDLHDNEVSLAGHIDLPRHGSSLTKMPVANLKAQMELADLANLKPLIPGGRLTRLDGSCEGGVEVSGPLLSLSARGGRMKFNRLGAVVGGDNLGLDGEVRFDEHEVTIDQLRWVFGASEGVLSGTVRQVGDSRIGRLGLAVDRFDLPDFSRRLAHWDTSKAPGTTQAVAQDSEPARRILDQLLHSEIEIEASAEEVRAMLPGNQALRADNGWARFQVQRGPVTINFRALVDGGFVTGEFTSHTQLADPEYHLTYTADSIEPGPLVDGYLRLMFPGMEATGPLTLIDETRQKLMPKPGEPNFEVGEGELIIRGGSIAGRAAPLWVTKIFPGLNFARFDFSYMHSWFKKLPNGQCHHQMIYQGQYYNVYMIGYADHTRWFRYEVGVDFLANFDSKYWAESGQGRIPLFIKTGRIDERGNLIEEEVNYVSPDRVIKMLFVENNPVVTVYHAVRKRVLGEQ